MGGESKTFSPSVVSGIPLCNLRVMAVLPGSIKGRYAGGIAQWFFCTSPSMHMVTSPILTLRVSDMYGPEKAGSLFTQKENWNNGFRMGCVLQVAHYSGTPSPPGAEWHNSVVNKSPMVVPRRNLGFLPVSVRPLRSGRLAGRERQITTKPDRTKASCGFAKS